MIGFLPFMLWVIGLFDSGEFPGIKELKIGEIWTRLSPFKIEAVDIIWRWLKLDSILSARSYDFKVNVLLFLLIIVSSVLIAAILRNQKRYETHNHTRMKSFQFSVVFISFSILFIIFLAFAFLISTQLNEVPNERILSPFLIGLFLGGSSLAVFFLDRFPNNQSLKYFIPTLFLIFSISQIGSSFSLLQDLHNNGGGYGSEKWQSSELLNEVQDLPQDIPIISNDAEAILLYTNRPAYRIPELMEGIKLDNFKSFGQDPGDEIQRIFTNRGAALVLFDSIYWQFNSFYFHQTEERLEAFTRVLYLYSKAADGEIYFYTMP
jgi:ABC-type multidrug transport system fused ATPase/permease subunit